MGREEYLRKLMEEIKDFPEEDRNQIKEYFEEMICDRMENGETEEEIMQAIGSPEQAGMKLRSEYESRPECGAEEDKQDEKQEEAQEEQRTYRDQDLGKQFSEKIMQASETAMQMLEKIIQVPEKILSDIEEKRRSQDMGSRYGQQGSAFRGRRQDGTHEPDADNVVYEQDVKDVQDVEDTPSGQATQTGVNEQDVQAEGSEQNAQPEVNEQSSRAEGSEQNAQPKVNEQNSQAVESEQSVQAEEYGKSSENTRHEQNTQTEKCEQQTNTERAERKVQPERNVQPEPNAQSERNAQSNECRQETQDQQREQSTTNGGYKQSANRAEYGQDAAPDELQFIRVQAENTKIYVRTVKRDTAQVLFQPRDGVDEVWTSEEGGGFTFNHRIRKFWFFDVWDFGRSKWITVEIPENYRGRVELITKNAVIQAENLRGVESLLAETSNARINVGRLAAEHIWLKTSNSSVTVSEAAGQELWVKSSNGHVSLDNIQFTENIDVKTSNAAIEISGVNGKNISLQTSNGAVRGWLTGSIADYDIESRTSNASSTLPTNMHVGKGKKLKVRTSNGKININFSENS